MSERELPTATKRVNDRGRPTTTGHLAGDDMKIEWSIYAPAEDLLGNVPIGIKVTFTPVEGQEFVAEGEFAMDPITLARRVKSEEDWKKYLVQMAQMTVMSAKRASELQS